MAEVGSLSAKLTLDKGSFSSALAGAKGELAAFGATAETGFSKLGTALGKAIQVGAAAAVVALGTVTAAVGAGTKAFAAYEAGLADVGRVSGANAEQLKVLGDELRGISKQTGSAVTDLEKLSVTLSSAGVAYEDLAGGTKLANSMMVAYGTSADKTGGFVGNLMKTYKMGTEDVRKYGSAMNVIEGAGKATPEYMMDYVGALSELNAMFDIDMKKAMAFGGVFADSNIQASEASTSLSSAISYALAGPDQKVDTEAIDRLAEQYEKAGMKAADAKKKAKADTIASMSEGNERMTKWAQLLGVSYEELVNMLNTDFMGTMQKSATVIGKITDNTKRLTVTNEIWGRYGTKSIAAVSGSIQNYGDYITKIEEDIISGSKSMEAEETRVYGTLSGMFKQAQATINDFGITIGEVTSGPLKDFLKWFLDSEPVITESLKQALSGDIFGAFQTLKPVLDDISKGITEAMGKLTQMFTSIDFGGILSGIQSKLASIDWGGIVSGLMNYLSIAGPMIVDALGNAVSGIMNYDWESLFSKVYPAVKNAFSKVGDAILAQPWASWAGRAADLLGQGLQAAITAATDVGKWILDKINSVGTGGFVEAGRKFAGWVVDGLGKIATLVSQNWAGWIAGGIQFVGTIVTAVGSFAAGIVTELGARIKEKATGIWDGLMAYGSSVAGAAKTFGANLVDGIGMGIASGVNAAFQPVTDFLNSAARLSNQILGTNFSEISLNVGSGNFYGTSGDAVGTGKDLVGAVFKPVTDWVNAGGGSPSPMVPAQGIGGLTQGQTLGYKNTGNMAGFLTEMGKLGKTFDQALVAMRQVNFEGINMAESAMRAAWGAGRGQFLGAVTGNSSIAWDKNGLPAPTSTVTASGATAASAPAGSAWNASGGILAMLNQGKGNSIVPGAYGVTGGVIDGTKVFVTNWPAAFGSGGKGGAMGCAVQSVDYGFGDGTKFTGNVTPGGPGIGMVGSTSANAAYANRLEIDTCEIDEFGMTPGLGKELAAAGVWKPIQGSPVSEKLANIIGYQGDYSNVGNTAMVGGIKKAYDKANASQITTQKQVNDMWTGGVAQANSSSLTTGQMVGQYQVQAAQFASNIQQNAAGAWYNSNVQSAAANTAAMSVFRTDLTNTGMGLKVNMIDGSSSLGSVLSAGKDAMVTGSTAITAANDKTLATINQLNTTLTSQNTGFNTMLGSLNATALGLTSMAQYMGIPAGGAFVSGGYGAGTSAFNWGGMTSISGGGGWVGTGTGATTLNPNNPNYRSWGGAATSAAVQAATPARSSYSISGGTIKIGKYADGGMVNRPQVAMIGEAGREAVLPNKLVETIMRGTGGDDMMAHVSINIDGKRVADAVGPAIIKRVQQGSGLKVR